MEEAGFVGPFISTFLSWNCACPLYPLLNWLLHLNPLINELSKIFNPLSSFILIWESRFNLFWEHYALTLGKGVMLPGQIKTLTILSYKNTEKPQCKRQWIIKFYCKAVAWCWVAGCRPRLWAVWVMPSSEQGLEFHRSWPAFQRTT